MFALLSPAKKLDLSPTPDELAVSQPALLDQTELLLRTVRKLKIGDLTRLMGISEKLALLNVERFLRLAPPFDRQNARPAALLFAGDTYQGLEARSFDRADWAFAADHLRILSGLYGLLRPSDLIKEYRLEMGTKLKTRRGASLYEFWGSRLTQHLKQELETHESRAVVNLASQEYISAVQPRQLGARFVDCVFRELRNGQAKVISFLAKRARGMMAHYIVKRRIDRVEGLESFDRAGYRFDPQASSADRLVFTRPEGAEPST
ncbi:MAG: peroxide stress protein YaaA [Myxococcales bacterium]|nr:peroxide stress protein YaaA [Myxococcales bacterium]